MRWFTKALTVLAGAGLAVSLASCSSEPGGSDTNEPSGTEPVGEFKTLEGVSTTVIFDPGFAAALTSLKLVPSTQGDATIGMMGDKVTAVFPITGGNAAIYEKGDVDPYVQGEIQHDGSGLTLAGGDTTFTLMNFVIHPGKNATLTGDVVIDGGTPLHQVTLFDLDGSTLETPTISEEGIATLQGTTIYLASDAADALNGVFDTDALAGGKKVKIGTAVIDATGS